MPRSWSRKPSKLKALVICGKYEDPNHQIDLQPDLDALKQHLGGSVDLEIWISDPKIKSKLEFTRKARYINIPALILLWALII